MSDCPNSVELASPAKVNLMLSVHGPQADGFHALTSVVVALDFGDRLSVCKSAGEADLLRCTDSRVPTGMGNLVLKAAATFRRELGQSVFFEFVLEKHIPMGAGLGGGSSNASSALLGMNTLTGEPFSKQQLMEIAAELGSDCPFFIDPRPSVMRGRGEVIEPLTEEAANQLQGQRLVLFRPDFGVETAWAYGQLRSEAPQSYESEVLAVDRLTRFNQSQDLSSLLFNSFETVVGLKYLALPCLLEELRNQGINCLMSGSGSCCFALLKEKSLSPSQMHEICRNAWGSSVFWVETFIS
ncbi:MAG: 4-(cytidine 5'-diphospho)-2-C-methyl-D-erythritol kinase [Opitutaceae bacterium]